jgi:N-acetylglucosaminyldiphosphoundecaprenol N-acetyl-beta-D-mannosaminyltransferase
MTNLSIVPASPAIDTHRFPVLDCLVHRTDMERATAAVQDAIDKGEGGYICFANVHTVVTARHDLALRDAINGALLALPDGKPLSVLAQQRGLRDVERVAGPDFMAHFLCTASKRRHYFYGSTPETLARLITNVRRRYPDAEIVGSYSPPFRALTPEEQQTVVDQIQSARPDVVWVGLGAPKQEYWMAQHREKLQPALLLGVGAAFDFLAGTVSRAPRWMGDAGLEWLYRLACEPRRLWHRYLLNNTLFVYYLVSEKIVSKH